MNSGEWDWQGKTSYLCRLGLIATYFYDSKGVRIECLLYHYCPMCGVELNPTDGRQRKVCWECYEYKMKRRYIGTRLRMNPDEIPESIVELKSKQLELNALLLSKNKNKTKNQ